MKKLAEKLACPICGAERKMLGSHMLRIHGLTAEETRQKFNMESLTAPATRFKMAGENNNFYGRHHSYESKDKMIMSRDGFHFVPWFPPLCKEGCGRRVKTFGFDRCQRCGASISNSGDGNPAKKPEVREKLVKNHACRGPNAEERNRNVSKGKTGKPRPDMVGENNPSKRPEVRAKLSKSSSRITKKLWQDSEYIKKQMIARTKPKNKFEAKVEVIINAVCPGEYKFVGDAKFFVGTKNPDFIGVHDQQKIIEAFGGYWHGEGMTGIPNEQHAQERIDMFAKDGFQTLIIWDYELANLDEVKKRILEFTQKRTFNDCNQNILSEKDKMVGQSDLHSDVERLAETINPVS